MKKVALFSTHCDTPKKQEILVDNLKKVRSLGLDTIVLSIIPLPDEIRELSDFLIYSKENPIPSIDEKCIVSWNLLRSGGKLFCYAPDYGYASLFQLKRLIDFGLMIGYDRFFTMIYDIEITHGVEKVLLEGRDCSFFKNSRVDTEIGGILTAFNRENAEKFSMLITKSSYMSSSKTAEEWMNGVRKILNGKIEPIVVNDLIFAGTDFFRVNYSPHEDFFVFIIKERRAELFLYEPRGLITIDIETNLEKKTVSFDHETIISLADDARDLTTLKIVYKGHTTDLSDAYRRILKAKLEK